MRGQSAKCAELTKKYYCQETPGKSGTIFIVAVVNIEPGTTQMQNILSLSNAASVLQGNRPDMAGRLRKAIAVLKIDGTTTPADVAVLDAMFASIGAPQAGYSGGDAEKRFSEFRSRVKQAILAAQPKQSIRLAPKGRKFLLPGWQQMFAVIDAAIAEKKEPEYAAGSLVFIARWATAMGIDVADFKSEDLNLLVHLCERAGVAGRKAGASRAKANSGSVIRGAQTWNRLFRQTNEKEWLAGLGIKASLDIPTLDRKFNVQLRDLSPELQAEVAEFGRSKMERRYVDGYKDTGKSRRERFGDARPVETDKEPNSRKNRRPISPASFKRYCNIIVWVANANARKLGIDVRCFTSLKQFANFDGLKNWAFDLEDRLVDQGRFDDRVSTTYNSGRVLCDVAAWAGVSVLEVKAMRDLLEKDDFAKTESVGNMSAERRDMLRAFDQQRVEDAWFSLARKLWKRGKMLLSKGRFQNGCSAIEMAICFRMMRFIPMRRENFVGLRIAGPRPTLRLPAHALEKMVLDIPAHEAKNRVGLYAIIPDDLAEMIVFYLKRCRGEWIKREMAKPTTKIDITKSVCLWPGQATSEHSDIHRHAQKFADRFTEICRVEGFHATMHFSRHIVAKILLDHNPGLEQVVADLLGDDIETVRRNYIAGNMRRAAALADEISEKRAAELREMKNMTGQTMAHYNEIEEAKKAEAANGR